MASAVCPCENSTHPKIVPLGAAGYEFYELFESSAGLDQIAALYGRRSLTVKRISFGSEFFAAGQTEKS